MISDSLSDSFKTVKNRQKVLKSVKATAYQNSEKKRKSLETQQFQGFSFNAPRGIRTHDLLIRSQHC